MSESRGVGCMDKSVNFRTAEWSRTVTKHPFALNEVESMA